MRLCWHWSLLFAWQLETCKFFVCRIQPQSVCGESRQVASFSWCVKSETLRRRSYTKSVGSWNEFAATCRARKTRLTKRGFPISQWRRGQSILDMIRFQSILSEWRVQSSCWIVAKNQVCLFYQINSICRGFSSWSQKGLMCTGTDVRPTQTLLGQDMASWKK